MGHPLEVGGGLGNGKPARVVYIRYYHTTKPTTIYWMYIDIKVGWWECKSAPGNKSSDSATYLSICQSIKAKSVLCSIFETRERSTNTTQQRPHSETARTDRTGQPEQRDPQTLSDSLPGDSPLRSRPDKYIRRHVHCHCHCRIPD